MSRYICQDVLICKACLSHCIWSHRQKISSRNIWNSSCSLNGCVKTFPLFLPNSVCSSSSFEVQRGNSFMRFLMNVFEMEWLTKSMQRVVFCCKSAKKEYHSWHEDKTCGVSQGGQLYLRNCWRKHGKDAW